jgi:hypothetical protein
MVCCLLVIAFLTNCWFVGFDVSIIDNTAWNGGGIYAVAGNNYFDLTSVLFEGNVAFTDGGGMLVITDHDAVFIHLCSFRYNEALSGIPVYMQHNIYVSCMSHVVLSASFELIIFVLFLARGRPAFCLEHCEHQHYQH